MARVNIDSMRLSRAIREDRGENSSATKKPVVANGREGIR
jgi:hypothetical protein